MCHIASGRTFVREKLAHALTCSMGFGWKLGGVESKSLHGRRSCDCERECTAFCVDAGACRCVA